MKKQVFIVLFTFLIFTEQIFAQTNLLNAKVPQEVGVSSQQELEANNSSPICAQSVHMRAISHVQL